MSITGKSQCCIYCHRSIDHICIVPKKPLISSNSSSQLKLGWGNKKYAGKVVSVGVCRVECCCVTGYEQNLLEQKPEIPNLQVIIPQNLLGPVSTSLCDPLALDASDDLLIKVAHALGVLVTGQTERDVMHPRPEPLVVPLSEHGELVDQTLAQQPSIVPPRECIAVNVQKVLGRQGVKHIDRLDGAEILALGVTVARVALANVGELDVEILRHVRGADLFFTPHRLGGGRVVEFEDLGLVQGLDLCEEPLAMLAPPATVARKPARRAAAPVHGGLFLLPRHIAILLVGDAAHVVPRRRVQDVLEAGDLGLGEDGKQLVRHVEGVGSIEKAKRPFHGRRVANVAERGGVADEAEWDTRVGGCVVRTGVVQADASWAVWRTRQARVAPGRLVGKTIEARRLVLFDANAFA